MRGALFPVGCKRVAGEARTAGTRAVGVRSGAAVSLAITCALLAASSCGGSDNGSGAFVGQYCDAYRPCCASAGYLTDGKQCRLLNAAVAGGAKYDAASGQACLTALQDLTSQAAFCAGQIPEPATCAAAFQFPAGTTAPGGACTTDSDCAPSDQGAVVCIFRVTSAGTQIQQCQLQLHGSEGATPCVGTVENGVTSGASSDAVPAQGYLCYVDDDLRCDGTGCVRLAATGETCGLSDDCVRADYCDFTVGTCAARKPSGAACTGASLECQTGTFCSDTSATCTPQLDTGVACTESLQCLSGSCPSGLCGAAGSSNFGLALICGQPAG
jgi:hypothetical protein